jgi:hypothetical protein
VREIERGRPIIRKNGTQAKVTAVHAKEARAV